MEYITPIVVALLGSGLWSCLLEFVKSKKNKKTAEQEMILGLGHDVLCNKLQKYLDRGWISIEELEDLDTYLYQPYRRMGGNSTGERLYEEVVKLPHKKESGDK